MQIVVHKKGRKIHSFILVLIKLLDVASVNLFNIWVSDHLDYQQESNILLSYLKSSSSSSLVRR